MSSPWEILSWVTSIGLSALIIVGVFVGVLVAVRAILRSDMFKGRRRTR